ncbi:glycosyltransferase [Cohnella lubricantis]|uniref:Glycosyltransferase n=1 Tax=Cohnella lubricantis TaxID=2163172 RepID=A0A841T9Y1_9BACL|nr:glycosyltransferase [Cohnella lubricantis]MBB6676835.1 glycosyltransferase [Cohnella lubricantis]MBP2119415.1 glycosyltransferase involved in cell wall biosynthesis [Cohnella lubricantis]
MKISVLVPTYRRVNDLRRCVSALLRQTRIPHEIIVVVRREDTETIHYAESLAAAETLLKIMYVDLPGVVQAMSHGLTAVTGDIVAITDDDSEPFADWLELLAEAFEKDSSVAGAGGRDLIYQDGAILDGAASKVGRLQWFGRMIGNHHLGTGKAREVDFLKGVNCAYRTELLRQLGFELRLRGTGAQVHWELAIGLALKRMGWKLIYDPFIGVYHYPSTRHDEDKRGEFKPLAAMNAVHNETLILWGYLSWTKRIAFILWAVLVGSRTSPGLLQFIRRLAGGGGHAFPLLAASLKGRKLGIQTWGVSRHEGRHRHAARGLERRS